MRDLAPGRGAQFFEAGLLDPTRELHRFDFRLLIILQFHPGLERVGFERETNHLSGQDIRPRLQFHERHLAVNVVQDFSEDAIDEIDLALIETERDGESQRRGRTALD